MGERVFFARLHCGSSFRVLAVCDKELVGGVYESKGVVLDLRKYASFYAGEEVSEEKALSLFKEANCFNLVGKNSVELGEKTLGISSKKAKKIGGVPHLQVYFV